MMKDRHVIDAHQAWMKREREKGKRKCRNESAMVHQLRKRMKLLINWLVGDE